MLRGLGEREDGGSRQRRDEGGGWDAVADDVMRRHGSGAAIRRLRQVHGPREADDEVDRSLLLLMRGI